MSKHLKVLAGALSAVMLLGSAGMFAAYAEAEIIEPDPVYTEPYNPDPGYDPDPGTPTYPDMPIDDPVDPEPYSPESSYVPDPGYNSGGGGGTVDDGGSGSNNNNNYNSYVEQDSNVFDPYATGSANSSQQSQVQSATASLYNVNEKKIDDKTLSKNDWGDIASRLKNAGNTVDEDDGSGDFTFIQQNNNVDDNGHWIIVAGVACLVLSLAGFIYLIASAISRRRKLSAATGGTSGNGGYYRADNDYDDGYSAAHTKKEKTPKNGRRYK